MIDFSHKVHKKTIGRWHDWCCRQSSLYDAWHEHPYSDHTHWGLFIAFALGWVSALLTIMMTIVFVPSTRSLFATAGQNATQIHYRWRNDDGTEAAATFAEAEDTSLTFVKNTTKRLRLEMSNEGTATTDASSYILQYAPLTTTCSAVTESSWVTVPASATTEHLTMTASANLTQGEATTNVASGLTDENTTFVAGTVQTTANDMVNNTWTSSQFSEFEYAVQSTNNATAGGNYCMRLIDANGLPIRTSALTLNAGENNLQSGVIDTTNGFAYFGTNDTPGIVIKVRLSDFTRVGALTLNAGEGPIISAVIDATNGFAYFTTQTTPGTIVKIRLSDFTRVSSLTLNAGEDYPSVGLIDTTNNFAYFATQTNPGIIVKVNLTTFARTGVLTLNAGENSPMSSAIDIANGFAYFGTNTSPGIVVKVQLSDLTRTAALTLNAGENNLQAAGIDTTNGFLYVGATDANPAIITKIRLANFTRTDALTLGAGEIGPASITIDTTNAIAYVATNTTPAYVIRLNLVTFTRLGALTLNADEDTKRYALYDATNGFIYHGTSLSPARVLKIDTRRRLDTYTVYAQATVDQTPLVPGAPTIGGVAASSFTITINTNSNLSAATYAIQITKEGGGAQWVQTNGTLGAAEAWQIYTAWGGASGMTATGLSARSNYTVAVKARNSANTESALSTTVAQQTSPAPNTEATTDTTPPKIPANFTVTATEIPTILLTWTDPADADLAEITVLRGEGIIPVSGDPYAVVARGIQRYVDTHVAAGKSYTYQLRVTDRVGNAALSSKKTIALPEKASPEKKEEKKEEKKAPAPSKKNIPSTLNLKELIRVQHPPTPVSADPVACNIPGFLCSSDLLFHFQKNDAIAVSRDRLIPSPRLQETFRQGERDLFGVLDITTGFVITGRFGLLYDLIPDGITSGAELPEPIPIVARYDPSDAPLVLQSQHALALAYFNAVAERWELVTSAEHDSLRGRFTASVTKAGTYGIVIVRQKRTPD